MKFNKLTSEQKNDVALDLMDKLLIKCDLLDWFTISRVLIEEFEDYSRFEIDELCDLIYKQLKRYDYIVEDRSTGFYTLSPKGQLIKEAGGHFEFIKTEKKRIDEAKQREQIELENLQSNTNLNTWLYKTRYLPHILSIIALIFSILALIFS